VATSLPTYGLKTTKQIFNPLAN